MCLCVLLATWASVPGREVQEIFLEHFSAKGRIKDFFSRRYTFKAGGEEKKTELIQMSCPAMVLLVTISNCKLETKDRHS